MADLKLNHLTKKYGSLVAVNDLCLDVPEGEFVVLLGPSGAGKTTTLKLISGVELPTSGTIAIGGRVVNNLEPQQRNVAMTFETYALYPHLTVYENIAFPLRAPGRKLSGVEIDKRVRQVAELLNIHMLLDRMPYQLSGGQKQRTSLGRTMVREPTVMLLDEPIAHLDAKLRHRMRAEFKHLRKVIRTATIYVTHDYLEALSLGDRVVVIDRGVVQQIGPPDEVFNKPANEFVAKAMGEPEINLFTTEVARQNGRLMLRTADGQISLSIPPQLADQIERRDLKQVRAGIRPMHLSLEATEQNGHDTIPGQVYVFNPVGTKGVLTVAIGDLLLHVLTAPSLEISAKTPVRLAVAPDQLMIFDPQTTQNIAYGAR